MSEYRWRKAGRSQPNGNCVEVAHTVDRLRDSKNPFGAVLVVDVAGLLAAVRDDRLAR